MTTEQGGGTPTGTSGQPPQSSYPVSFDVAYPEEGRNRLTVFFRLILVIPIFIVMSLFGWDASFSTGPLRI